MNKHQIKPKIRLPITNKQKLFAEILEYQFKRFYPSIFDRSLYQPIPDMDCGYSYFMRLLNGFPMTISDKDLYNYSETNINPHSRRCDDFFYRLVEIDDKKKFLEFLLLNCTV